MLGFNVESLKLSYFSIIYCLLMVTWMTQQYPTHKGNQIIECHPVMDVWKLFGIMDASNESDQDLQRHVGDLIALK